MYSSKELNHRQT